MLYLSCPTGLLANHEFDEARLARLSVLHQCCECGRGAFSNKQTAELRAANTA